MIDICDSLIAVIQNSIDELYDYLEITDVKLGDPGLVTVSEYPYIYVQPVSDQYNKETLPARGYEVRDNVIEIGIVIDQSSYFNPSVSEVSGLRELVNSSQIIRKRLRTKTNRSLGGIARDVKVPNIVYDPQVRGDAYVAVAKITAIVQRQYPLEA